MTLKTAQLDEGRGTPLDARAALVTGAGGGIGRAIARALATQNFSVGLVGRRRSRLAAAAQGLGAVDHELYEADLSSDREVRAVVRSFLRRFGRLDVLIHSNGTYASAPLEHARMLDFDRLWSTNVRSPFLLTQLLLPALTASLGQVVFVNSSAGLGSRPGAGQFSATQFALKALAETFRAELNAEGVRVLNVYPGRTATDRQRKIFQHEGRIYEPDRLLQPEDIASVIVECLGLPRTAEVTDIQIRSMTRP